MTETPTVTADPAEPGQTRIHLPEFTYLDTQVWSVDISVPDEVLPALRDAINARLTAGHMVARTAREEDFARAGEAVDEKLFRMTNGSGLGHSSFYALEELIAAREAARIRALPGFPGRSASAAADAIDPEMRRRAAQEPCTVSACPEPQLGVLIEWNGNSLGLIVLGGGDHERVDTVLLSTDDQVTIRYGLPAASGEEPVGPPVPGRGRLLAHVRVRAGATAIHPADITSYPWET